MYGEVSLNLSSALAPVDSFWNMENLLGAVGLNNGKNCS